MAFLDHVLNPHSFAFQNYGAMDEKVENLIESYIPFPMYQVADVSSLTVIMIRLPFSVAKTETGWTLGRPDYDSSMSGLLSLRCPIKWVGLLDMNVEPTDQEAVRTCLREVNAYPVFLDSQMQEDGVIRFGKNKLWSLFHYSTPSIDGSGEHYCDDYAKEWKCYRKVNRALALGAIAASEEQSIIWVHDYHLMLVPRYLRKVRKEAKIGYFQHIPFPSSEFFRMFPYRSKILKSLVCSNLLGFNGHDHLCNFLDSCTTVLGLVVSNQCVDALATGGCYAKVGVYPVTADYAYLQTLLKDPEVQQYAQKFKASFGAKKIIVGVDKVDYVKGVTHKLLAYERFLHDYPEWRGNVILVQILGDVQDRVRLSPERQKLLSTINIMISKINGIYGTFSALPIHHLTQKLPTKELMALLSIADMCYLSTLRDGMNVVSFEFVSMQRDNAGVLLLSEFAGAAQCVGAGAIIINPWNLRGSAAAIKRGLEMSMEERQSRHTLMSKYLEAHTPQQWAEKFLRDIASVQEESAMITIPKLLPCQEMIDSYTRKKRRLLIFSVLNVLTDPVRKSMNAVQYNNMIQVNYTVMEQLRTLGNDHRNVVILISTLEPKYMDRLFFGLPVWLGAENGFYYKLGTETTWQKLHEAPDLSWREEVLKTFTYYKSHTPGAFITGETSDCTFLSWNYGSSACSFEFQSQQAKNLLVHLFTYALANSTAELLIGDKCIEVRPYRTSPKDLVSKLMKQLGGRHQFDFVNLIGSFNKKKDEDLYRFLAGSKE